MRLQVAETPIAQVVDSLAGGTGRGISFLAASSEELLSNALLSLLVILILVLARRVLIRAMDRWVGDPVACYRWTKSSAYLTSALAVGAILLIWFEAVRPLGTFLGLLAAGLAIALRDPVANFAGWAFILWRRPFDVGDRIQVGPDRGDVVDQRIFQFTLLEVGNWVGADQSTGRIIHVPNQKVFTEPVANFTADFDYLWNEVGVLISFESDWRKAKELIASVAYREVGGITQDAEQDLRQARGKSLIFYRKLSPIVYTSVVDSGVLLTLRYLCRPRHRRGTAQAIWESLLDEFSPCEDIDFAYPTQRVYYDPVEGKPARQTEALSKDATARAPSAGRGSTGTSPHPPVVGETRE